MLSAACLRPSKAGAPRRRTWHARPCTSTGGSSRPGRLEPARAVPPGRRQTRIGRSSHRSGLLLPHGGGWTAPAARAGAQRREVAHALAGRRPRVTRSACVSARGENGTFSRGAGVPRRRRRRSAPEPWSGGGFGAMRARSVLSALGPSRPAPAVWRGSAFKAAVGGSGGTAPCAGYTVGSPAATKAMRHLTACFWRDGRRMRQTQRFSTAQTADSGLSKVRPDLPPMRRAAA